MPDITLPPHIAVKAWLREQRKVKANYRDWFDDVNETQWRNGKFVGPNLPEFAENYEKILRLSAAFSIKKEGDIGCLRLKAAKSYGISGVVLWPITIGVKRETPTSSFAEEAVLLSRVGMEFSRAKVVGHEAPLNVCVTRHALERMVERGALHDHIAMSISRACEGISRDLAVILALGVVDERGQEGDWGRTAYVPYNDGALVVTNRLVAGPLYAQDFGWKYNFNKRKYSWSYLKKDLLVKDPRETVGLKNGAMVSTWFVTTFLSSQQLDLRQKAYCERLRAWLDRVPGKLTDWAFAVQFDPDFVLRPDCAVPEDDKVDPEELAKLRQIVTLPVFKSHPREPTADLLDTDTDNRTFREHLRKFGN